MVNFQLFFSVQGTGSSPTGQDPEDRVGDHKTLKAQVSQFLLGCKCPVSRGIVVQEKHPLGGAAFFLKNILQLYQQR
jgi:hypothetical protein